MSMRSIVALGRVALAIVLAQAATAGAAEVKLLAGTGMRAVLEELLPQFERSMGHRLSVQYGPGVDAKRQIEAGEAFDLVITTPVIMDELIKQAKVARDTHSLIARSGMGLVARADVPKPAIDSPDALKRALLAAKSIAYFPDGTS